MGFSSAMPGLPYISASKRSPRDTDDVARSEADLGHWARYRPERRRWRRRLSCFVRCRGRDRRAEEAKPSPAGRSSGPPLSRSGRSSATTTRMAPTTKPPTSLRAIRFPTFPKKSDSIGVVSSRLRSAPGSRTPRCAKEPTADRRPPPRYSCGIWPSPCHSNARRCATDRRGSPPSVRRCAAVDRCGRDACHGRARRPHGCRHRDAGIGPVAANQPGLPVGPTVRLSDVVVLGRQRRRHPPLRDQQHLLDPGWARLPQYPCQPASAAHDDVAAEDADLEAVVRPGREVRGELSVI